MKALYLPGAKVNKSEVFDNQILSIVLFTFLGDWGIRGIQGAVIGQETIIEERAMEKTKIRQRRISDHLKKQFDAMAEEATVDCYNESEQTMGWFTMIEEHLKLPFETKIVGVPVTVERIDLNRQEEIVAVCHRGRHRQTVPILDLPLPAPPPEGTEWVEAYRRWSSGG